MELSEFIKSVPVTRALLPLMAGIITSSVIEINSGYLYFCLIFSLIIFPVFLLNHFAVKPYFAHVKALLITFLFFLSGICLFAFIPSDKSLVEEQILGIWICEVKDFPVEKTKTFRCTLRAIGSLDAGNSNTELFILFVYFTKDEKAASLAPGDIIRVRMKPMRPQQIKNPHEFDYREYLFRKGISYQAFVNEKDWSILKRNYSVFKYFPLKIQHHFVKRLKSIINSPENFGILSALAVGTRVFIDEEISNAYSDSGAMHVLAVSGLHVGLVWYVLNLIFGRFKNIKYTRLFYWLLMTSLLWMYVMITGMSPSVTRAGIMLSIIITADMVKRSSTISNPVLLSAFIMLVINPLHLMDVGFQFSYLAVLGILFFQPRLKGLWQVKNPVLKYLWELITVSVAAQVGTIVPAIFYFNKFPTYFLLTNIIVLPLVTIILFCIIISAFFWLVNPVFNFLIQLAAFVTGLMNSGVKFIESLHGSSIRMLYIDHFDVLILTFLLLFIVLFLYKKRSQLLFFPVVCVIIFLLYGGTRDFVRKSRGFIAVHCIPEILAIDFASDGMHFFITSGLIPDKKTQIIRNFMPFWLHERVATPVFIDLKTFNNPVEGIDIIPIRDTGNRIILFNNILTVLFENLTEPDIYISEGSLQADIFVVNIAGKLELPSYFSYNEKASFISSSGFRAKGNFKSIQNSSDTQVKIHTVLNDGSFIKYFNWNESKK